MIQNRITSSVRYDGVNVMAWACVADSRPVSLVFIYDVTADKK